jgi:hypothetical protein
MATADKELEGLTGTGAKMGVGAACQSLNALLPGAGVVCASLGASAVDVFTAFMVIDDKLASLGSSKAAEVLAGKLQGQWGSLVKDITKDLAVCKSNGSKGTCGARTAVRVTKAILASRPLDAGDGLPGTLPTEGQLSPALACYARSVIYAAFDNQYRSNKDWKRWKELEGMWDGVSGDEAKLAGIVEDIEAIAEKLQNKWDQGLYGKLEVLKSEQKALQEKMGLKVSGSLGDMFAVDVSEKTLIALEEASIYQDAKEAREMESAAAEYGPAKTQTVLIAAAAIGAVLLLRGK